MLSLIVVTWGTNSVERLLAELELPVVSSTDMTTVPVALSVLIETAESVYISGHLASLFGQKITRALPRRLEAIPDSPAI
jgi:hypothetical protein